MTRGCLWLTLNVLGAFLVFSGITIILINVFGAADEVIIVGIFLTLPGVLLLYFVNRSANRMRRVMEQANAQRMNTGEVDQAELARTLHLDEKTVKKYLGKIQKRTAKKQREIPVPVPPAQKLTAERIVEHLRGSAWSIRIISEKTEYRNLAAGMSASGLILISQSLQGVSENIDAAATALGSGIGMDRRPITHSEIADGLQRMYKEMWDNPYFTSYMSRNLSTCDYESLSSDFDVVRWMISAIRVL